MPYQNWEVIASVCFYLLSKLLSYLLANHRSVTITMHDRHSKVPKLTSIPERNEAEEALKVRSKWVPKKKHEVLKAKYKCLKKLFQIYDASVIGILPEPYTDGCLQQDTPLEVARDTKIRKRSHRTKTVAGSETNDQSTAELTVLGKSEASALLRDLNIPCSCTTQIINDSIRTNSKSVITNNENSNDNASNFNSTRSSGYSDQGSVDIRDPEPMKDHNDCKLYSYSNDNLNYRSRLQQRRQPTKLKTFINRIFGLKKEKCYRNYNRTDGHVYAASENNFNDRRRRRGLKFRRLRRTKKVQSEIALRELRSPILLNFVQSVQKNCLMDTTQRKCPVTECSAMLYGIINYNDHLNYSHFMDRNYCCHYCHEGFHTEYDKVMHENEHIGISKINNMNILSTTSTMPSPKKVIDTQTDPEQQNDIPKDKLKKIVSFFDKIADTEKILCEMKTNRYSESNLRRVQASSQATSEAPDDCTVTDSSDKRTVSCGNLVNRKMGKSKITVANSELTSKCPYTAIQCHFCGEQFNFRRQLSLHVDLEHRVYDKFSKFHSCSGLPSYCPQTTTNMASIPGNINVQTIKLPHDTSCSDYTVSQRKSDETLREDPSTNILYYESNDSMTKKASVLTNFVEKVRSGVTSYRWEPGTKIIRV